MLGTYWQSWKYSFDIAWKIKMTCVEIYFVLSQYVLHFHCALSQNSLETHSFFDFCCILRQFILSLQRVDNSAKKKNNKGENKNEFI